MEYLVGIYARLSVEHGNAKDNQHTESDPTGEAMAGRAERQAGSEKNTVRKLE